MKSFRAFSVWRFHLKIIIFVLLQSREVLHEDEPQLISSQQSVVALVGDDVILPCQLEPPINAASDTVVWTKPGLIPKYVHFHQDGRLVYRTQNPAYKNRTALFVDELKNGNVSLKLHRVKISDAGKYFCYLQTIQSGPSIQLTVGAVSRPIIDIFSNNSGEVVLKCESEGWYPEPEVSWLDGEGHVLSAGPTETVRGPDGLYTVSSRVTVDETHSNSFTCRVQQKNINQTRETQIHVPARFFTDTAFLYWACGIAISLVIVVIIIFILLIKKRIDWRNLIRTRSGSRDTVHSVISDEENKLNLDMLWRNLTHSGSRDTVHSVISDEENKVNPGYESLI